MSSVALFPRDRSRIDLDFEPEFRLGTLLVRPAAREVRVGGRSEILQPRVMQVLVALARRPGETVSRDELIELCWDGRIVSDDAINRAISKLREVAALDGGASFRIQTLPRLGYRLFESPAEERPAADPVQEPLPAPRLPRSKRRLLGVLALLTLIASIAFTIARWTGQAEPVRLAVLPFRNLSNGDAYFAEGVAEEILGQLSRQPGLHLAGRTSSWAFKGNSADARTVGEKLDVAYVLEGSVRTVGDNVRVNVALVRAADGIQLWSETYGGRLDDIFAIQNRIGGAVAESLKRKLVHAAPLSGPLTTSGDVYNIYLTARGLLRNREPASTRVAVELLQRAVKLDPGYAPAWTSLGSAIALNGSFPHSPRKSEDRALAIAHVRRALALAPNSAEAHAALASLVGFDSPEAARHLRRAAELDPNSADIQAAMAQFHGAAGNFEQRLQSYVRAAELDPLYRSVAGSVVVNAAELGYHAVGERQIRRLQQASSPNAAHIRGHFEWARGNHSEAIREFLIARRVPGQNAGDRVDEHLGELLRELGYLEQAQRAWNFDDGLWSLWKGRPPSLEVLRARNRMAPNNPSDQEYAILATKLLLNAGRGPALASAYDSSEGLLELSRSRTTRSPVLLVRGTPLIALALRQAGRSREGARLLSTADQTVRAALRRGRAPHWFYAEAGQTWALQGKRALALRALEQAMARGWIYAGESMLPDIADEPAFRSLRGDPRFESIRQRNRTHLARERAQVRPLVT